MDVSEDCFQHLNRQVCENTRNGIDQKTINAAINIAHCTHLGILSWLLLNISAKPMLAITCPVAYPTMIGPYHCWPDSKNQPIWSPIMNHKALSIHSNTIDADNDINASAKGSVFGGTLAY